MRRPLLAVAIAAALLGCSHQPPLRQLGLLHGRTVTVVAAAGEEEQEGVVIVAPEGWFVRTPRGDVAVATASRVTVVDRRRGAREGLGVGALVGVLAGAVIGLSSGDDECGDDLCLFQFSAGEKAVLAGLGLGVAGSLAGMLVGAAIGSRDVYELGDGAPRVLPSGPPGSVVGATVRF